jgi:hypothetical protein
MDAHRLSQAILYRRQVVQFWADVKVRRAVADAERPLLAKIRELEDELARARKAVAKVA